MVTLNELFGADDPGPGIDMPEVIVLLGTDDLKHVGVRLEEGRWTPSAIKGLWVRIDAANPAMSQERHVHVAQKKHLRAPSEQASWTTQGRRHDRYSFNARFGSRSDVKDAARRALGLPAGMLLEGAPRAPAFLTEALSGDTRPPVVLRSVPAPALGRRIAALEAPSAHRVILQELREIDGRDCLIRVVDAGDEIVAECIRERQRLGPRLTVSRETLFDSGHSPSPITPASMVDSLGAILGEWAEEGWLS